MHCIKQLHIHKHDPQCGGQGYRDKPVAGKGGIGLKGPLAEKGFNAQTDFKALGS